MIGSAKSILSAILICILFSAPVSADEFSRTTGFVEAKLRQSLQLPVGPATQFVSFHIPGNGLFVVATTDFSMRSTAPTPFGASKNKQAAPSPDKIRKVLKTVILSCKNLTLPAGENESLYIILVNRSFFTRPDEQGNRAVIYKAYIPIKTLRHGSKIEDSVLTD